MSSMSKALRCVLLVVAVFFVAEALQPTSCNAQGRIRRAVNKAKKVTKSFAKGVGNRTGLRNRPLDRRAPQAPPNSTTNSRRSTGPQPPSPSNSPRSSAHQYARAPANPAAAWHNPNVRGAQPRPYPVAQQRYNPVGTPHQLRAVVQTPSGQWVQTTVPAIVVAQPRQPASQVIGGGKAVRAMQPANARVNGQNPRGIPQRQNLGQQVAVRPLPNLYQPAPHQKQATNQYQSLQLTPQSKYDRVVMPAKTQAPQYDSVANPL